MAQTWTVGQTAGAESSGQRRRVQQDLELQSASILPPGAVDRYAQTASRARPLDTDGQAPWSRQSRLQP